MKLISIQMRLISCPGVSSRLISASERIERSLTNVLFCVLRVKASTRIWMQPVSLYCAYYSAMTRSFGSISYALRFLSAFSSFVVLVVVD